MNDELNHISEAGDSHGNESPLPVSAMFALIVAGLWGCLSIYSSRALGQSPFYFVQRQVLWLLLGVCVFLITAMIPFRVYCAYSKKLFYLFFLSLLVVLLVGVRINGMKGWIQINEDLSFQPSEFAKVFFILFLCVIAKKKCKNEFRRFLLMFGWTAATCGVIMLQPDLGTALIFGAGFLVVYWVSGGYFRYLCLAVLTFLVAAASFVYTHSYAWDRITGFFGSGDGVTKTSWHILQFQYAMAQGGVTGAESGSAVWSNAYLPLSHSDSLYASIVESSGLVGGWIVIGAFLFLAVAFTLMSRKKGIGETAGQFIFSLGMLIVIQALLHISVNVVLIPTTGVTLPVLSYGGSSLFSTMIAFGIIVSASRPVDRNRHRKQSHEQSAD